MTMMARRRVAGVVLALLVSGCAASPYYATPAKKAFLPRLGSAAPLGERKLLPHDTVTQTPIGFRDAARLETPVTIEVMGRSYSFAAGEVLPGSVIAGAASNNVPPGSRVMCGPARATGNLATGLLAASTLGISNAFRRTEAMTQLCLLDRDGDDRVEAAILVGVKKLADAAPVTFTPVAYTPVRDTAMGGDSQARLIYEGSPGKTGGNLGFDLAVVEGGTPLFFSNRRTQVQLKNLPQRIEVMGAALTVKSYDPADGSVVVELERGFPEGDYSITTTTTTTYIPIYIPR